MLVVLGTAIAGAAARQAALESILDSRHNLGNMQVNAGWSLPAHVYMLHAFDSKQFAQ